MPTSALPVSGPNGLHPVPHQVDTSLSSIVGPVIRNEVLAMLAPLLTGDCPWNMSSYGSSVSVSGSVSTGVSPSYTPPLHAPRRCHALHQCHTNLHMLHRPHLVHFRLAISLRLRHPITYHYTLLWLPFNHRHPPCVSHRCLSSVKPHLLSLVK